MATDIEKLVHHYFEDSLYQQAQQKIAELRTTSIPFYRNVIEKFVSGQLNIVTLRMELSALNKDRFWNANGSGFLIELRKLDSNHIPSNPELTETIRQIVTGLNSSTLGQRIEQWYLLMRQENERLMQLGLHQSLRAAPTHSAFIVSLLAHWLDAESQTPIYYRDVRVGLFTLLSAQSLPFPEHFAYDASGIIIATKQQHQQVSTLIHLVAEVAPELTTQTYWAESFFLWIAEQIKKNPVYLQAFKDPQKTVYAIKLEKIFSESTPPDDHPSTSVMDQADAQKSQQGPIAHQPDTQDIPATVKVAEGQPAKVSVAAITARPGEKQKQQFEPTPDSEQRRIIKEQASVHPAQKPAHSVEAIEKQQTDGSTVLVAEEIEYETTNPEPEKPVRIFFADQPLPAIPEGALIENIRAIARRLLIDEQLIRRIYHTLLNSHVILTGPPGTGKTELARLLPEMLWHNKQEPASSYTTTLVTATSDWNPHTLISSIIPIVTERQVSYDTQFGHLTHAIMKNWSLSDHDGTYFHRATVHTTGFAYPDYMQSFRGHWLVIDEFNRGPIDSALGETLTLLSNGGALHVPMEGGYVALPLPQDFRIIGTLNSFDRHYLNTISEALKRRFAFIEIPPPSRRYREAEQNIVLYKALRRCQRFTPLISIDEHSITWQSTIMVGSNVQGFYDCEWEDNTHPLYRVFYHVFWPTFEVIRMYRQLGTAQAISVVAQMLTTGILQQYTEESQWLQALDMALCDVIVDQLHILMPDELETLLWYCKLDADSFISRYNDMLALCKPRRLLAHLEAIAALTDTNNAPYLTDEQVEMLLTAEEHGEFAITPIVLRKIFNLSHTPLTLPSFSRRLRMLKAERGI